jgi:tetratricopeptide (TPR) repeat protein
LRLDWSTLLARATARWRTGAAQGRGVYDILFVLGLAAFGLSFLTGTRELVAAGGLPEFQANPLAQARRLAERGLLDRAVGQCRMAALIDPSAPTTWYTLGQFLTRTGRYDEAEQALERALTIDPGLVEAWIALGDIALDRDRPREAAERYSQAVAREPRSVAAHNGLGIALDSLGLMDGAIENFAAAAAASGDPAIRANLERAKARRVQGPAGPRSPDRP